jgi:hypothetical protein
LSASTTPQAAESRLPQAAESRRSWHLILSAGTNWLTFVAQLTATFFLWPLVIRALGDARYGVWSLAESILAYCTLLDLGIAACVVRDTARFRAVGRERHDQPHLLDESGDILRHRRGGCGGGAWPSPRG